MSYFETSVIISCLFLSLSSLLSCSTTNNSNNNSKFEYKKTCEQGLVYIQHSIKDWFTSVHQMSCDDVHKKMSIHLFLMHRFYCCLQSTDKGEFVTYATHKILNHTFPFYSQSIHTVWVYFPNSQFPLCGIFKFLKSQKKKKIGTETFWPGSDAHLLAQTNYRIFFCKNMLYFLHERISPYFAAVRYCST